MTTVISGGNIPFVQQYLAPFWERIVSKDAPFACENGGRIIGREGDNLSYFPLTGSEIQAVLTSIRPDEIKFLGYFPKSPTQKGVIWTPQQERVPVLRKIFKDALDITTMLLHQLERQIQADSPCMMIINPVSVDFMRELAPGLNASFNEGFITVNTQNINKGTGVVQISDITGISLAETLVAGNDHNDLPMFELPVGMKIFVGDGMGIVNIPADAIRKDSPEELGKYLQAF